MPAFLRVSTTRFERGEELTFEVRDERLGDALDFVQTVGKDVRGAGTFARRWVGGSWRTIGSAAGRVGRGRRGVRGPITVSAVGTNGRVL